MTLIKARGAPETSARTLSEPKPLTIDHYRAQIKIDRNALDLCAEEQPELFLKVAEAQVFAVSRRDAAKDELLRTDARLGREARAAMVEKGVKPTEGGVADVVLGEKEHLELAAKVAALNKEVDEWSALRSALEHRKSMIRELATLFASGYYTAGAASGARGAVRDANAAAGREALTKAREGRDK
jgi:hypothetical protein